MQRQIRESTSDAFSNKCIVDDDGVHSNPSTVENDISLVRTPSTEVLILKNKKVDP